MRQVLILLCLGLVFIFNPQAHAQAGGAKTSAQFKAGMVVADNPTAAQIGGRILEAGGDAVDAAVATAFALGVVHPFASGIGGGGFAVVHRHDGAQIAFDFREVAPQSASQDMFVDHQGKIVPGLSRHGALAVAVPGEIAGLYHMHKRYGKLPWDTLIAPSIELARNGFVISDILHWKMKEALYHLRTSVLFPFMVQDGARTRDAGMRMRLPPLADTLELIAKHGAEVFYRGVIATQIVNAVKGAGGVLSLKDLASYTVKERTVLRAKFRDFEMITMPPPSSGGLVLIQALRVLLGADLRTLGHNTTQYLHRLVESLKHGFADRAREMGDPDFVSLDHQRFIGPKAIERVRSRFDPNQTKASTQYGAGTHIGSDGGTSHLSVVDRFGNAVALTTTINTGFGSRFVAGSTGIVLNNQMDDFVAQPGTPNSFGLIGHVSNAIAPRKRPLSSMSPTILLKNKKPFLVIGASGGPMIISSTLQVMLNIIVFGMSPRLAVDATRIHHQWMPEHIFIEPGSALKWRSGLKALGHRLFEKARFSSVQVIYMTDDEPRGGADASKGGAAYLEAVREMKP
ncbi:MAG: gamma-glutamyltransferase [Bradymonadia bacterium]